MTRSRLCSSFAALALLAAVAACAAEPGVSGVRGGAASAPASSCAACHAQVEDDVRISRLHDSGADRCLTCHLPHAGASEGEGPAGLRARCEDCHAAETAQFSLAFRHPLGTAISCTSCHPPHGGAPRELREHLRKEA